MFQKGSHPKTQAEHEQVQKTLSEHETSEHEVITMQKSIEVMDKYHNENQFIHNALEERWSDYETTLDSLQQSISTLKDTQHTGEVLEIDNLNDKVSKLSQVLLKTDKSEDETPSMTPEKLSDFIQDKMVCPYCTYFRINSLNEMHR